MGLLSEAVITTSIGSISSIEPPIIVGNSKEVKTSKLTYPKNSRPKLAAQSSRARFARALTSFPPILDG